MSLLFREWGLSLIVATLLLFTAWMAYDAGRHNGEQEFRESQMNYEVASVPEDEEVRDYYERNFSHLMAVYLDCKAELDRARSEMERLRRQIEEHQ